jgi:ribonucleoside-triphosphate reductase
VSILRPEFVAPYKDKVAPWGFGGLGEIVYLRTYSRRIEELGRNETWVETLERVINGAVEIGVPYTQDEAEAMFDHMFNLRCSFSGRALWQLGTPLVRKFNAASLNNCFHGDTEIITSEGVRPISELANTTVQVLTEKGWINAPVNSFGVQSVQKIVFRPAHRAGRSGTWRASRTDMRHNITATPNHRWLLADGITTDALKVGDIVKANINPDPTMTMAGFIHGFVFGDGTIAYERADGTIVHRVRLCGTKDQRWLDMFLQDEWRRLKNAPNGDPILVKDFPVSLKRLPDNPNPEYAAGFLEGWIAADGHSKDNNDIHLCSQHDEASKWLQRYAAMAGYLLVGECAGGTDATNYGKRANGLTRFSLTRSERAWVVESITSAGEAEVFCPTVPEVEAFTLASGIYTRNCYFVNIESIEDFEFLFDYLMLGGGVGFSVERSKIHELPKIKAGVKITHERTNDADIIVPDSRHGWRRLLHSVLKSYFETGRSFTYSTILVREFGAPLKSFGGTASGPGALIDGINDICKVMENREGKKLRSVDVLDICNIIGRIVVSGSSRRSAQIAIGDPDDILFLRAKNWGTGNVPGWRSNSNNSIYADAYDEILPELWKGYDGSGEPYGLLNRKLARTMGRVGEKRPDPSIEGFNPCAEIALGDGESCNLATLFLPNIESLEQFKEISRLLYMVQKQITDMDYPYEKTTQIVRKNRRLGQSITGILQASEEQLSWLKPGYEYLDELDIKYSAEHGFNRSVRLTTVQPSGTLSLLPGVTPGVHPAYARYYIRRVRFSSADPLVDACRKRGYKVVPEILIDGREDHTKWVVEFPCKSPDNAVLAKDMTAVDQLEWVKKMQSDWADNAVSVTVYYRKEELPAIKEWLAENYDKNIKSVSFLLHSDHNFPLPPYEEITQEQYEKALAKIDMSVSIAPDTAGDMLDDPSCATGACPVR